MNIYAQKLDLIARLMEIDDESILSKVKDVLKKTPSKRKNTMEPEEEERLIHILQESQEDYIAGRVHSQKEVEAYFKAKQ